MDKYHFIGIGGIGMSALARLCLQQGFSVQGSDRVACPTLEKEGATVFLGQKEENIHEGLTIIYSSDIKSDNPERKRAEELHLPIFHRSEFLQKLMVGKHPLFVTGTHGKTTTTALLASVLSDSSFAVGGILRSMQTNAKWGKGPFFVVEGDESDGSFLKGKPFGAIVTNLEREHLDYWKTDIALTEGFRKFFAQVENKDLLFWCADDPELKKMEPQGVSYGFDPHATLHCPRFEQQGFHLVFDAVFRGVTYKNLSLPLIGKHNVSNALAVFGLALSLEVPESAIRNAFATFGGTMRRMEPVGTFKEATFYDDYAHHPTEIQVTLQALKQAASPRRLVAVFQAHRYSRVRDLIDAFATCFSAADLLLVTDIYSAGEKPIAGIDTPFLLQRLQRKAHYLSCPEDLISFLKPNDVVVTLGAGDITHVGRRLCQSSR